MAASDLDKVDTISDAMLDEWQAVELASGSPDRRLLACIALLRSHRREWDAAEATVQRCIQVAVASALTAATCSYQRLLLETPNQN